MQGLSYEYPNLAVAGKTRLQVLNGQPSETVYILYDFDCFHGPAGSNGSRRLSLPQRTRGLLTRRAAREPRSPRAQQSRRPIHG